MRVARSGPGCRVDWPHRADRSWFPPVLVFDAGERVGQFHIELGAVLVVEIVPVAALHLVVSLVLVHGAASELAIQVLAKRFDRSSDRPRWGITARRFHSSPSSIIASW